MKKPYYITQYYSDNNPERKKEIDECVMKNINSGLFEDCILIVDPEDSVEATKFHCKIYIKNYDGNLRFNTAFEYANQFLKDEIVVLANTDIYFDESIRFVHAFHYDKYALALSRKEKDGKMYVNTTYSQDVWIFKAPMTVKFEDDVLMGVLGCDNVVAGNMIKAGYTVKNYGNAINCWHMHDTNVRNYDSNCPFSDDRWTIGRVPLEEIVISVTAEKI